MGVAKRSDVKDVKDLVRVLSSNNPNYKGASSGSALKRLIFGYGWAAERSHFYNAVAQREGADAYLAPLRDAFCESCCRIDYPSQVTGLINALKSSSQETLVSILEPTGGAKFAMRLPFFTGYCISKVDKPGQCIELALSMRNQSEFQDCRTIFHNLAHLSASDRLRELNGILKYLEQSCTRLMKKYGVSTDNGIQFSLSLGLAGPNASGSYKISDLFRSYKNASFSRVFRNIAQDMLNVEKLGVLYDKVRSSLVEHPEATYPKIPTTPKFMELRESSHGRPAEIAE